MARKPKYPIGKRIDTQLGVFKVMAFSDGWYMLRRPRCTPFVDSETRLESIGAKLIN